MGQEEAHSRRRRCKRSGAAAARSLAAEAALARRSSRSFGGLRCIEEERFAGSRGRRRGLVGRLAGSEEEVREEEPSIRFL